MMAVFTSKQIVVPSLGPTFVDYLETTGAQYIAVGFTSNNNTRIVIDVETIGSPAVAIPFGGWQSQVSDGHFAMFQASQFMAFYGGAARYNSQSFVDKRVTIDANKNSWKLTVNGKTTTISYSAASFTCGQSMYLMAANSSGRASNYFTGRIYSCQIYDNGTLVRDFWPCYDPDGVACLLDKVESEYYYNQGSGEFIAGVAA